MIRLFPCFGDPLAIETRRLTNAFIDVSNAEIMRVRPNSFSTGPLGFVLRLLGAVFLAGGGVAQAQYPDRPVRLVVPQAAGSATDTHARLVAAELPKYLGQPVIVDNRPGGALTIGIDVVAKAAPDGYTIGIGPVGALAITRHMVEKLPYDIERDLAPVMQISRGHMVLAVSPTLAVGSVAELIDYAKKNPGKLLNASSSNGSPGHVCGELFKLLTGTQIVHVPYKGGSPAISDLMAGHVQLMFESMASVAPHVRSGKVRALAVSGRERSPAFPQVPTMVEAGVAGYEVTAWTGIIAPARTPRVVIDTLNRALNAVLVSPSFRERWSSLGDDTAGGTPEEFAERIRHDSALWADVVKRSGARID